MKDPKDPKHEAGRWWRQALSEMSIPAEFFGNADAAQAIAMTEAVIAQVGRLADLTTGTTPADSATEV